MTDEQLKQSVAQAEQDAITLNYAKWSFQQVRAKRPNDHETWQQERDAVLARQQSENAETRRKYLAKLAAEKAEKQAERQRQIDIELAPEKKRLQNQWLVDHPGKTESDFNKEAWLLLRENLIEARNNQTLEAEKQRQLSTGRYSL
ncbi:hypothetical protein BH20ACI1_BH20ACI1_20130 [soil metagenome]